MKFTVSTKPLKDSLNLGIINKNVNCFQKSTLVQITANKTSLIINTEADSIISEIHLKGVGDEDRETSIIVDSLLFKKLISPMTSSQIEFEFEPDHLTLRSGKSTFTMPKLVDTSEMRLQSPHSPNSFDSSSIDIVKSDWEFIRDHQLFAKATSYVNAVYTMIWVGESGDVLVSDFVNSLFTRSKITSFAKTCLLSDTIVNLFSSLPDGAKMIQENDSFVVSVTTDGFDYIANLRPKFESNENGNYNSDIIIGMMENANTDAISVNVSDIKPVLNQMVLLHSGSSHTVTFDVSDGHITISDENVCSVVDTNDSSDSTYSILFNMELLKPVITNCSEPTVQISPILNNDVVSGILITSGKLTIALAGMTRVDD